MQGYIVRSFPSPAGARAITIPPAMGQISYEVGRFFTRWLYALSIRHQMLRPQIPEREGGYILAPTHISHLEPAILSTLIKRRVDWMARIEFYRYWIGRWILNRFDAFPVNRYGVPVRAIRTAINRAKAGKIVGIFPEGNVMLDDDSVCRGGPIKGGACLIAIRADVPIIPCVLLGTHSLTGFYPWVPFRRGRIWMAFGDPIAPIHDPHNHKAARKQMTEQLAAAYRTLYLELLKRYDLPDRAR